MHKIINSIVTILFIANNFIDFAQLQEPNVELQNWVKTVPTKWPQKDGGKDGSFYFYHNEASESALFGINSEILDGVTLATGTLNFLFKYWTDSQTCQFISRIDTRIETKLTKTPDWEKSPDLLKSLTLDQFRRLEFANFDPFTVAFKDVKIQYLEEMTPEKLVQSPIHGYKADQSTRFGNLKFIKNDQNSQIYEVKESNTVDTVSYLNLVESQLTDKDLCYQMSQLPPNLPVEVYFTFEKLNSGIKLFTMRAQKTNFCINDYISLRNLKNFQLTFAITGKVDQAFQFTVTRTEEVKSLLIRNVGDEKGEINRGWFYQNSMYGFDVLAPENSKFWACDVVVNCYPFTGKQEYSIGNNFRKFLDKSPLFRIQIEDESLLSQFKFSEHSVKSAMKLFRQNLISSNKWKDTDISQTIPGVQTGQRIQVPNHKFDSKTNQTVVRIPLDQIDLRSYQVITEIKLQSPTKHFVYLVNLAYRNGHTDQVVNFPFEQIQNPSLKVIKLDHIQFSTETLFAIHPSDQLSNGKFIELTLEAIYPNTTMEITFDIQESTLKTTEQEDSQPIRLKYLSSSNSSKITLTDIGKINKLEGIKFGIFFTNWIRAGKLSETKLDSNFTLTIEDQSDVKKIWNTDKGLWNAILVYRMIFTQKGHILTLIPQEKLIVDSNSKNKTLSIQDGISRVFGGSFRISYVFILNSNFTINIKVDKFQVKSSPMPNQNCENQLTLASVDCKYESVIRPDTFDSGENKPFKMYRFMELECDPKLSGCSNIFNQSLAISSVYATDSSSSRYIPHQIKLNGNINSHYLKVTLPTNNAENDFCIQFDYKSKVRSLQINANEFNSQSYSIEYSESGFNQNSKQVNEVKNQIICASYLSNSVQDIKSIYFRFVQSQIIDTDEYYVKNLRQTQPLDTNSLEVLKGIELNKLSSTQFIQPGTEWSIINDKILRFVVYDLNDKKRTNGNSFVSFLRTKWFEAPNPGNFGEFRLGYNLTGVDLKQKDYYRISLIVSSTQTELFRKDISNSETELIGDSMHIFPIDKSIKHYQMTIKVELDLSTLEFKHENEKMFNFTFESFTVNDPCVDDKTNRHVSCNGHAQTCTRRYDTFSPKCNCEDGFVGNYCQTDDYCKKRDSKSGRTNDQYCPSQPKCRNNYVIEMFECDCGNEKEWDHATKTCIDKTVKCKENEYSTFGLDGKVQCDCIHDYIRVKGNCERFNPCNVEHRKVKGFSPVACADPNAKCQSDEHDGFTCECKSGFVNQFADKGSNAKCLHNKCEVEIGTCEHKCIPKDDKYECACFDGYSMDKGKCTLKDAKLGEKCQSKSAPTPFVNGQGNCECIQGYMWNETICLLETDKNSYFGKKFQCEKGVELVDTKPACVCDKKNQVLDIESRSCKHKSECTKNEAEKCKKDHNSDKCTPDKESGEPLCGCDLKTQVKYASIEKEISRWTCIRKCDLFLRGFKDQGCNGAFQECQNKQVLTDKHVNETFIGDSSKITSENNNLGHCTCGLGFETSSKDAKQCEQRKEPQVDLVIDFSIEENLNIIEAYFRELIQTAIQPKTIDRLECLKKAANQTKLILCRSSFPFDQPIDPKRALLDKLCKPIENSPGKCAYLLPIIDRLHRRASEGTFFTSTTQWSNILVREKVGEIKIEQINLCKSSSPCKSLDYSYCHKSNESHYITCQCDETIFDVKSELLVGKYQSCKLKDLCTVKPKDYGCTGDDAKCNLKVDYDTTVHKYVAQSFCTCGSSLTLPNRSLSCKQTCNRACGENSESCAQDLYDPKRFICKCAQGYKGDKCQDKEGLNIFLFATIGASVVALIALISLGVFCFKRNSKNIRQRS